MPRVERLAEWQQREIEGVALTNADRALCARLAAGEGPRLEIEETLSGLRVTSRSWVGLAQLAGVQVQVAPKLAGDHAGLLRLIEWVTGVDGLVQLDSEPDFELDGATLADVVALLLVRECERILRRGIRSGYVEREETLPVLRGRLLAGRQMRRHHGRVDRLECRHDERTADVFDNRLLLAAIERCTSLIRAKGVRRRAGRVRAMLAQACDARSVGLPRREIAYDRLNSHYRAAHELAWLVLESSGGLDDLFAAGRTRGFAFLIDMNRLFERFVERTLGLALGRRGVLPSFQKATRSTVWREDTGASYQQLIPDVLVTVPDAETAIPLDAKYKRYTRRKLDPADVAQLFLYASGLGSMPAGEPPRGLVVYPSEGEAIERLPLAVRDPGGRRLASITAVGISIPAVLEEVVRPGAVTPLLDALADLVLGSAPAMSRSSASPARR